MTHIFLDPDETLGEYLIVIVEAATGVIYQQQCGGYATEQRFAEGFLVPVGSPTAAKKIYDWFWSTFQGHCYHASTGDIWTAERTHQLRALVGEITCWLTTPNEKDTRHPLALDPSRMNECIEAWIPVLTPYGRGILTLQNSD